MSTKPPESFSVAPFKDNTAFKWHFAGLSWTKNILILLCWIHQCWCTFCPFFLTNIPGWLSLTKHLVSGQGGSDSPDSNTIDTRSQINIARIWPQQHTMGNENLTKLAASISPNYKFANQCKADTISISYVWKNKFEIALKWGNLYKALLVLRNFMIKTTFSDCCAIVVESGCLRNKLNVKMQTLNIKKQHEPKELLSTFFTTMRSPRVVRLKNL